MGPSDESDEVPPSTYIVAAVLGLSFVGCLIYLLSLIWRVLASILPASKLRHKPAPAASSSAPVRSTGQAAIQAPPQAPGVSMKTLLKQAKAGQGRAAAQDKATHHPLYLNTLKGHGGNVSGLDVSLDGGAIATAADDRTVRVYRLEDAISKNNNFKHKVINAEPVDVAFGADSSQVAVLSKGGLDAANVSMLGPNPSSGGGPLQTLWEVPNCHGSQAAIGLHSGLRCGGPHGLLMTCSEKSDMRLFSLSGKLLAVVEPSGLQNHMASLSLDARFFAAATFTSDVKVHEAKFDKHGEFQGTTKVMDLKGHKSQVLVMAFSPDSTRAMTASKDGTYKLWSLDVRYQLNEDAKCLYTRDQQAPKGSLWKHMVMMDNDTFAAAWDSTVQFINASTGQVTATIEQAHEGPISYMQFAGSKMKAGDESVHVLLTAAQKQVRLWRAPKGAASCTAVRP